MQGRSGHISYSRRTQENAQLQCETVTGTGHTMATSSSSEPNIQGFAQGSQSQGTIRNADALNNPRMPPSSPRMRNDTGLLGHAEPPPVNRNNHVRRHGTVIHTPIQTSHQSSHDSERPNTCFKSRIRRALYPFSAINFDESQLLQLLPEVKSILEDARSLCVVEPAIYNSDYRSLIGTLVVYTAANSSSSDFEKSAYEDIV